MRTGWLLGIAGMAACGLCGQTPASPSTPIVELPALVVESSNWLYAKTPGAEYLSHLSEHKTRLYIEREARAEWLASLVIPVRFRVKLEVLPATLLTAADRKPPAGDTLLTEQAAKEGGNSVAFIPNLRLWDVDAYVRYSRIDESSFSADAPMVILPAGMREELERHLPALPAWLLEGLVRVYSRATFPTGGEADRVMPGITLMPLTWTTDDEQTTLFRDPERPHPLLPLVDLVGGGRHEKEKLFAAEAELFCRWAYDPASGPGVRDAFWKFADRCCAEAATPQLFAECFGFDMSEMRDRLSDYLPVAMHTTISLPVGKPPAQPTFEVRPATTDETNRIRGEWERLEITYVKRQNAGFVPQYTARALSTLSTAVSQGDHDPRLLATLGLCDVDAGNDALARTYLEQAVAAKVARPRAYYELGRLRCEDVLARLPAGGKFGAADVAAIDGPLRTALAGDPPLSSAYLLLVSVLRRSEGPPPAADLAALKAVTKDFFRPGTQLIRQR